MTPQERIESYRRAFPKFPPPYLAGERIEGLWIMGNQYQTSGYYGAYPHGYLARVRALFPDMAGKRVLHLFSGSLPVLPGEMRFDIRQDVQADFYGDAHQLSRYMGNDTMDFILADPPYSVEDAEHYGVTMVKRITVFNECYKVLRSGGWVIWLDQVFPRYSKTLWHFGLACGMIKSTNHRVRAVFGFQKR